MSMAVEVLDVSFNSGHYTVIIKQQFLYINTCSFSTIFIYMLALVIVHDFVRQFNGKAKRLLVWWDNSLIKVEIYVFFKYRSDRSIYGWETTTSGFWKQRGSQNLKVGHVTSSLDPFDLICIFSVRALGPQWVHKMASWSALIRLRYCDF